MKITDEILSAFIDGELDDTDTDDVKEALLRDKALVRRLEQLKSADRLIASTYGAIDKTPMPTAVLDMLAPAELADGDDNIVRLPFHRIPAAVKAWAAPIAATLMFVVGLGLGAQFSAPDRDQNRGSILAAGEIDKAGALHLVLETVASAETYVVDAASGAAITPLLTFRTADGAYCREFTAVQGETTNRGVACRKENAWEIQFAARVPAAQTNPDAYSTASAGVSAQFDEIVDNMIAGEPLGPDEERTLLKRW